jgi:DNA-binding response OmpR family regulator
LGTDKPDEQPLSILVVDDNPDDLTTFARTIRARPWKLETADSGRAGLEKALRGRFDVIVLDYNLGDMTGTEVLLRIKEAGLQCPVLIQSGLGSDFIVARALTLGAEGFIAKDAPAYDEEILAKVGAALQRARTPGLGAARRGRRESVQEVENVLDDLMERGRGHLLAVGFASPDGFRVSTRFRTGKTLSPETICAMVASATSTCNFLGEGLTLPGLRLVAAEFDGGRLYAAPVPGFGVLFAALQEAGEAVPPVKSEIEFAAKELTTLLSTMSTTEQYSY